MTTKARIRGIGAYTPEKVLTNKDFEKIVETSDEWIVTRTGIRERRIAAADECTSDMGAVAAQRALAQVGMSPEELDLIIVATSTPDYLFPSTATLIQHALGATRAAAFDFQAACTGYVYGLSIAKSFIESGAYRNVMVIASEKLSSFVDYEDRATSILFGDGAAATLLTAEGSGWAIEGLNMGADGQEAMLISVPGVGAKMPFNEETLTSRSQFLQMHGREVFKHGVRRMAQSSQEALDQLGLAAQDIQWLVPHQANIRIIESVAKRLNFSMDQIYLTVHKYGNTSASSVPIAMAELLEEHKLAEGDRLLLTAVGAGLTWGSAVLRKVS